MSRPIPIVHNVIFQLRYKSELSFFDLLYGAAQKFPEFANWQTDRLSLTLRNFNERRSLTISHNMLAYRQDSSDPDLEKASIQKILAELPEGLGIESFLRLGYRKQYLVPLRMAFESLLTILQVKLLSQNEDLRVVLPEKIVDLTYRIDFAESDDQFHLTAGAARKDEIPLFLTFDRQNHLKPEVADEE